MAFPKEHCGPAAGMSQRTSSPLSHGTVTWEELCPPEAPLPADQVLPCTVAQLAGGLCPCCLGEATVPHSCGDVQQARSGASCGKWRFLVCVRGGTAKEWTVGDTCPCP